MSKKNIEGEALLQEYSNIMLDVGKYMLKHELLTPELQPNHEKILAHLEKFKKEEDK